MVVRGETVIAVGRHLNTAQEPRDAGVEVRAILEMLKRDAGIGERSRDDVLKAELGIELVLRRRPVGVLETPRVHPDVDTLDRFQRGTMRKSNLDRSVDGGMRAAAARILLDRNPGTDDVQRIGPGVQPAGGIVGSRPVVDLEKTLLVLEY